MEKEQFQIGFPGRKNGETGPVYYRKSGIKWILNNYLLIMPVLKKQMGRKKEKEPEQQLERRRQGDQKATDSQKAREREALAAQGMLGSARCLRSQWCMSCSRRRQVPPSRLQGWSSRSAAAGNMGCVDSQLSPFLEVTFLRKEMPDPNLSSQSRNCPSN